MAEEIEKKNESLDEKDSLELENSADGLDNSCEEAKQDESEEKDSDSSKDCSEGDEKCKADSKENKEEESFQTKYIRLSADFQNYKKRTEKEKSEIYKSANSRLITELLPLIDDFDRAIAHSGESSKEAFSDGIEMIIKRFSEVLCKEGLEYIETKDAIFDPNLHHAVMAEEVEGVESDKIILELQKGYKVNGKVVRPSMVKVSK